MATTESSMLPRSWNRELHVKHWEHESVHLQEKLNHRRLSPAKARALRLPCSYKSCWTSKSLQWSSLRTKHHCQKQWTSTFLHALGEDHHHTFLLKQQASQTIVRGQAVFDLIQHQYECQQCCYEVWLAYTLCLQSCKASLDQQQILIASAKDMNIMLPYMIYDLICSPSHS